MAPERSATQLLGPSTGTRSIQAKPGAIASRWPISYFSYEASHNRETVLLSKLRVFGEAPRRIWGSPARRWLEAQARLRGMYFRPHCWAWDSRLRLTIVLPYLLLLLSHSARQIQCAARA